MEKRKFSKLTLALRQNKKLYGRFGEHVTVIRKDFIDNTRRHLRSLFKKKHKVSKMIGEV